MNSTKRRVGDLTSAERKEAPLFSGTMSYFPDALCAVAVLCKRANDKHNPGEPMHWSKDKSADHADCLARHSLDRGRRDEFNLDHRIAVAWRALSDLQTAIEEGGWDSVVGPELETADDEPAYEPAVPAPVWPERARIIVRGLVACFLEGFGEKYAEEPHEFYWNQYEGRYRREGTDPVYIRPEWLERGYAEIVAYPAEDAVTPRSEEVTLRRKEDGLVVRAVRESDGAFAVVGGYHGGDVTREYIFPYELRLWEIVV